MEIVQTDLWTTNVYEIINPNHNNIAEPLKTLMYEIEHSENKGVASGVAIGIKKGLFESDFDFFKNKKNCVEQLKSFCANTVLNVCKHENQDYWKQSGNHTLLFNDSWFHITRDGGFHDYHNHANCSWCGIYYVDIGESNLNNGSNAFFDPRISAHNYADYGTKYINDNQVFRPEPKNGKLMIFPSYVYHSAMAYSGKKDRIIISFNSSCHFQN